MRTRGRWAATMLALATLVTTFTGAPRTLRAVAAPVPVLAVDFPDPAVAQTADGWAAYGTNAGGMNVPVATSPDLEGWTLVGDAVPADHFPTWAAIRDRTWAPGVVALAPDRYVMYLSVPETNTGRQCIAVLTADGPAGPFTDATGAPLFCGWEDSNGVIDPQPLRALDGRLYLYTKDVASPRQLWVHELSPDGLAITPNVSVFLLTADASWEAGGIENPTMVAASTGWWLLYSGNWWTSSRYAVGAARCEGPMGPCQKVTADGPWISSASGYSGPGGQSIAVRDDGEIFLVFHAWNEGKTARELHARPVSFLGAVPALGSPAPVGDVAFASDAGTVTVRGHADDPSTTDGVEVVVADRAPLATVVSDPASGEFSLVVPTDGAPRWLCAAALNNEAGANTSLGCDWVNPIEGAWPLPAPIG